MKDCLKCDMGMSGMLNIEVVYSNSSISLIVRNLICLQYICEGVYSKIMPSQEGIPIISCNNHTFYKDGAPWQNSVKEMLFRFICRIRMILIMTGIMVGTG